MEVGISWVLASRFTSFNVIERGTVHFDGVVGFGAAFVAHHGSLNFQRLCCWMDFSFVAPGTHDQMVCFLIFGRRGVWQPVQQQQAYLEFAVAHLVLAERWPEDVGR